MRPTALAVALLCARYAALSDALPSPTTGAIVSEVSWSSETDSKWPLIGISSGAVQFANGSALFPIGNGFSSVGFSDPGVKTQTAWLSVTLDSGGAGLVDLPTSAALGQTASTLQSRAVEILALVGPNFGESAGLWLFRCSNNSIGGLLTYKSPRGPQLFQGAAVLWSGTLETQPQHSITVGVTLNAGIAVWVDGSSAMEIAANHSEPYTAFAGCGSIATGADVPASASMLRIRSCSFLLPEVLHMYVDSSAGDDNKNDGSTAQRPFRTISRAAYVAVPGSTIHIADGEYRESLVRPPGGLPGKPVTYAASGDAAYVLGSIPGSGLFWRSVSWSRDVWQANLSVAQLGSREQPRFVVVIDKATHKVARRLHVAREPDFRYGEIWRYTEYWNVAQGGKAIPTCVPGHGNVTDCDWYERSDTQLIDSKFAQFSNSLVGAQIIVTDCNSGHYIYRRPIVYHSGSTVRVNQSCLFDNLYPTLGLYSAWYVEGQMQFLDSPGEYLYDASRGVLYVALPGFDPSSLEISVGLPTRAMAFDLGGRSHVTISGLHFRFFQWAAVQERRGWVAGDTGSLRITLTQCKVQYCNYGVYVQRGIVAETAVVNWTIDHCEIGFTDSAALVAHTSGDIVAPRLGVVGMTLSNSYLHDLGFNSDDTSRVGISFMYPQRLRILNNTVSRVSESGLHMNLVAKLNGTQLSGDVLVRGNTFSQACCAGSDCTCYRFWGHTSTPRQSHVWRGSLVTENLCQSTFGWSRASWERQRFESPGYGAAAFYMDNAGGVALYRNVAFNVASTAVLMFRCWEDSSTLLYNNLLIGSAFGISFSDKLVAQTVVSEVHNNVIIEQLLVGFRVTSNNGSVDSTKIGLSHNLFHDVSWAGSLYEGLIVIQNGAASIALKNFAQVAQYNSMWEPTNYSIDPGFGPHTTSYNMADPQSVSRHVFLQYDSSAFSGTLLLVDKGTALAPSLVALLDQHGVCQGYGGAAYDLGPYERNAPCASWLPSSGVIPDDSAPDDQYDSSEVLEPGSILSSDMGPSERSNSMQAGSPAVLIRLFLIPLCLGLMP